MTTPIDFLRNCGVAPRHAPDVFADFRRDEDCPDDVPMTPEEFERLEAWVDESYDALGLDEYEDVRREMEAPQPRRFPKPLTSPCGDADEDYPF